MVVLKPLHDRAHIKRVAVSTYQAASGAGRRAFEELRQQTRDLLEGNPANPQAFPHQIAFNVIPQIDVFQEGDCTKEEWKMVKETQKIMGDDSIKVTATCVRVPVFFSHSEAVNIEKEMSAGRTAGFPVSCTAPSPSSECLACSVSFLHYDWSLPQTGLFPFRYLRCRICWDDAQSPTDTSLLKSIRDQFRPPQG